LVPRTAAGIHRDGDGDVWAERAFAGDQAIESLVLPGFQGRVAELWLDVEDNAGATA
jgi:hypothetical protein